MGARVMMASWRQCKQRGDTLVEVLLSMAVISMVIGSSYALSNRATQLGRLAQQRTQVNNLMSAQAELLRTLRDQQGTTWTTNVLPYSNANSESGLNTPMDCKKSDLGGRNSKPFYISSSSGTLSTNTYSNDPQAPANPGNSGDPSGHYQIWIEPYSVTSGDTGYSDYYIVGCWQGVGSYGQQQSFIVERLNNTP